MDLIHFEDVKGKKILEAAEAETNSDQLSKESAQNYLFGMETSSIKRTIENYAKIQLRDLKKIAHKYLTLFSLAEKSQTTIICEPEKVSQLVNEFKQLGIVLKTYDEIGQIFK